MVALAYQQISLNGPYTQTGALQTFVAPAAAAADNTVPPDDRGWLEFENSNATARTVTINPPASSGLDQLGVPFPNMVFEIAATSGRRRIGPLDRRFADTDGLIHFTVSSEVGVVCAALRI